MRIGGRLKNYYQKRWSLMVDKIANRSSWKNMPLPDQRARLSVERTFPEREYNRLSRGLIPKRMEDKWFIYMEDDVLAFHRSWTGVCVYEVHFDNQKTIKDVLVNRKDEQYQGTDDEYDEQLLMFLIDNLLLEQNRSFPMPSNLPGELPKGLYQHAIFGTG